MKNYIKLWNESSKQEKVDFALETVIELTAGMLIGAVVFCIYVKVFIW